jgi:hypothetical protein
MSALVEFFRDHFHASPSGAFRAPASASSSSGCGDGYRSRAWTTSSKNEPHARP